MPGPGGGAHGGGGGHHGGGGPHGGGMGPHGGGFGGHQPHPGGGMYGPPRRRMYRGGLFHRPRYYGRGGCLGCLGVFFIPIVLLVVAALVVSF